MKIIDEAKLYQEICIDIETRRSSAYRMINSEMVLMYWTIGNRILSNLNKTNESSYGKRVIKNISSKLTIEYGDGFNESSIFRMMKFAKIFNDYEKVATMSQKLSWSHIVELISLKDDVKRDFYLTLCLNESWNVRELREKKKSMLFERTAISKMPNETIGKDLQNLRDNKEMSIDLFVKDPLIFDFLNLNNTFSERDLENSILQELQLFILEMGADFAFLARQKHIIVDGKDYYMDLLFYHRTLRRLVLIELKLGEFAPEHKGQVELYLKWLIKNEKREGEKDPIALILCAEKSDETIRLLDLDNGNIRICQYLTKLPPKDLLKKKMHEAILNVKKRLNNE